MSESSESVRWNACVHRLHLGFYSHLEKFLGMESEPMITPREKSHLLENSQRRIEPTTLHQAGQPAQRTTNKLFQQRQLNKQADILTETQSLTPHHLCQCNSCVI